MPLAKDTPTVSSITLASGQQYGFEFHTDIGIHTCSRSRSHRRSLSREPCLLDCGLQFRIILPLCFNTSWSGNWQHVNFMQDQGVYDYRILFTPSINKSGCLKPSLLRSKVNSFLLGPSLGETTSLIIDSLSFNEPEFQLRRIHAILLASLICSLCSLSGKNNLKCITNKTWVFLSCLSDEQMLGLKTLCVLVMCSLS